MAQTVLFNGDYTRPFQTGLTRRRFDPETLSYRYAQTWQQRVSAKSPWRAEALSAKGPDNAYLVEETEPRPLAVPTVVEWERRFAAVPPSRTRTGRTSHNYQTLSGGQLGQIAIPVPCRVETRYVHALNPASITLASAYRYLQIGSVIVATGTPPPVGAEWVLADDETCEPWLGNIYRIVAKYVPAKAFA